MKFVLCAMALAILIVPGAAMADEPSLTRAVQWMLIGACAMPMVYFAPALIVASRDHPRSTAIFIVNLTLGWTVIGWIFALVWAVIAMAGDKTLPRITPRKPNFLRNLRFTPEMAAQEMEDLLIMKERALISEDEYAIGRKLILDRMAMTSGQSMPA